MTSVTKYAPPAGFELRTGSVAGAFELSAIDGKELWLLRVPDNVSAKQLDGLKIKHPKSSRNGVLGEITAGASTFQVVSPAAGDAPEFKGMAEMSLLVPDGDESALTLLPARCTELLSLTEKIDIPDPTEYARVIATRDPPARPQPENMKLQFLPYGFYSAEEYKALDQGAPLAAGEDPAVAEPAPKKRKKDKSKDQSSATSDVDTKPGKSDKGDKAKKDKKDKKSKKAAK
ncbi:hypothetical protein H4R21_006167 [Coemansia helicoidea]|uniref:Uncharacterized protein n=1 Tax=Coemansia helicoidea TaxID=1286919 RepID=A0ACC1KNM8_9FUNG|nr:hypothetical protein H4R21_006167 [Coemansia helicoidea]